MMGNRRVKPLLPQRVYFEWIARVVGVGATVIALALGVGMLGYHFIGKLPWIDALLNASMILTGMGPVDKMEGAGAKLFASAYALLGSLIFVTTSTLMLIPIFQRALHRYHLDMFVDDGQAAGGKTEQTSAGRISGMLNPPKEG